MDRETVIAKLRAHEEELKNAGVLHLSLFGSVARGAAGPDSDVDLIVEFDKSRRLTLIGAIGIENRIADLLGVSVDLAQQGNLKPRVQARAEREAVLVF